jgi:hypothetical protein
MEGRPVDLNTCGPELGEGAKQAVKISLVLLSRMQRRDYSLLGLTLAVLSGETSERLAWTHF